MESFGVYVEYGQDGLVTIKLNMKLEELKDVDPVKLINEIKDMVEAEETIMKRSKLGIYFGKYLEEDIKRELAKLILYYSLRR